MAERTNREIDLIRALVERGREIAALKTHLALYAAFLTPLQKKSADAYMEALKRGKENR